MKKREEMLAWLVKNVTEWPSEASVNLNYEVRPHGWISYQYLQSSPVTFISLLDGTISITREDWQQARNTYSPADLRLQEEVSRVKPVSVTSDVVNHPKHYTQGGIECIEAIAAATVNKKGIEAVCVANVVKYLWRYEEKNGVEDIRKAQWYLNKLLEEVSK